MRYDINDDLVKSVLNNVKLSGKGHITAQCPFCGDNKDRFYLKLKTEEIDRRGNNRSYKWDCKHCSEFGGLWKLFKHLNKLHLIQFNKSIERDKLENKLLKKTTFNEEEIELPIKSLPLGFRRIYESEYLQNRGFTKEDFQLIEVGKTNMFKKFKDYVIFPIYNNGKRVAYLSRYTGSKQKIKEIELRTGKKLLRWNNSENTDFGCILGGLDEINENVKTVILVEGFFHKKNIDKHFNLFNNNEIKCLFTFGKKITDYQIKLLNKKKYIENIILFFDRDAIIQMKKYSYELMAYYNVQLAFISNNYLTEEGEEKDGGDLTEEELFDIFDNLQSPLDFYIGKVNIRKLK